MPDEILADPNEPGWRAILVEFAAANDTDSTLWSEQETVAAQNFFAHHQPGMPSVDQFIALFGKEALDATLQTIFSEKKFTNDIRGIHQPCHSCGARENLSFYEFGLLRVQTEKRDWKMTGLSIALSAVSLPLLGIGRLDGPHRTTTGNLLRLRLVLCPVCTSTRKNFFGVVWLKERHCIVHPLWKLLQDAGFTKFIPGQELKNWS